ncbi:Hypothetical_protein [Hexamita inflata]|uniref:Hypothetical_protein n=1 Tax=Hexamita inflata TaxID=28002 RepID=A0AA86RHT9_9EUKA|nr:Hypothetical protein HINF_LOCUS62261 [Hexamita inflata]
MMMDIFIMYVVDVIICIQIHSLSSHYPVEHDEVKSIHSIQTILQAFLQFLCRLAAFYFQIIVVASNLCVGLIHLLSNILEVFLIQLEKAEEQVVYSFKSLKWISILL